MGSQRVGHDWATELNWTEGILSCCEVLVKYLIVYLEGFEEKWELKWNYRYKGKLIEKKKRKKFGLGLTSHCPREVNIWANI